MVEGASGGAKFAVPTNAVVVCAKLEAVETSTLDEECLGVLDAVRRLNEINRRLRNLIANNVQNRLGALTGNDKPYAALPRQNLNISLA